MTRSYEPGRVAWTSNSRVVDISVFHRMRTNAPEGEKAGAKRLAKALGCSFNTAATLMRGQHWQQDPERVRMFNRQQDAHVDPETGQPTDDDLKRFGAAFAKPRENATPEGVAGLALLRAAGVPTLVAAEAQRRARVLAGQLLDLPGKVDAAYIDEQVGEKLKLLFAMFDSVSIASLPAKDFPGAIQKMIEIRALVRGEPTQIIRTEHRLKLDGLTQMAIAEAKRRGIKIVDMEPKLIGESA